MKAVLYCKRKRVRIAGSEQLRLGLTALSIDGPDRMNDVLGGHPAGSGNDRLPRPSTIRGLNPSNFAAVLQYFGPARAMNRAVDSTTTHQSTVGGIHNGVDCLLGD